MQALVDHGASVALVNTYDRYALRETYNGAHLASVRKLLAEGASLNRITGDNSDLGSLLRGTEETTMFAIDQVRDTAAFGNDILAFWWDNHVSILEVWLKLLTAEQRTLALNARFLAVGYAVLFDCAFRGQVLVLETMLNHGAAIDAGGGPLGSPLMVACAYKRLAVVKTLVRRGASIILKSAPGKCRSACALATKIPDIRWWLLVERSTDQKRLSYTATVHRMNTTTGSSGTTLS